MPVNRVASLQAYPTGAQPGRVFGSLIGVTLVFDLDGTLIDTAPDLVRATNHVLASRDLPAVASHEIRPFVSFGARRMIEQGLALHRVQLSGHEIDGLFDDFLAYYAAHIAVESRPYPGLGVTLDALTARGATLAVCTNKREDLSRRLLSDLGLTQRFAAICGRDTFSMCKPHPEHLTKTITMAGGNPRRAVMVGDSNTDVATAKAAGIAVIGVSFGYTDIPMRDLAPDVVIDHYAEFEAALATLAVAAPVSA